MKPCRLFAIIAVVFAPLFGLWCVVHPDSKRLIEWLPFRWYWVMIGIFVWAITITAYFIWGAGVLWG